MKRWLVDALFWVAVLAALALIGGGIWLGLLAWSAWLGR